MQIAEELVQEFPTKIAIQETIKRPVESCSDFMGKVIPCEYYALLQASHVAFDEHRPLVLSPDILWITIVQGLALHINADPERFRKTFVDFEGKQEIEVEHDGLIKGALENPWHEVFDMFSQATRGRIGTRTMTGSLEHSPLQAL